MHIRRLPAEDDAIARFVDELKLPYQRELTDLVAAFALADDGDHAAGEREFVAGKLEDGNVIHVAVDAHDDAPRERPLADVDAPLAGFTRTSVDAAPDAFARPDRLLVCELYVVPEHRGTGLADDLLGAAAARADAEDCPEVALHVDVDNHRARRYYEKRGFEPAKEELRVDTSALPEGPTE
jgi:ribosomal protein S18 acetylase RimI-like enzyme